MKVYVVLVQPKSLGHGTILSYVHAVFYDEKHAKKDAKKYLREHPYGWAEVQSFIVV